MEAEAAAKPAESLSLGRISDPAAAGLPAFAREFTVRREPDGRIFAVGEVAGCDVYVQPRRWKELTMTVPKGDAARNYGVSMPQLQHEMAGTLSTNDPGFGAVAFSSGSVVAAPAASGLSPRDALLPGAIVLAAVLIFLVRFRGR